MICPPSKSQAGYIGWVSPVSDLRNFIVDLHIHTCLSACGSPGMIPPAIVAEAKRNHIEGIGITDHNSAANVEAVMAAGKDQVVVFGGMEVMTREEIHILVFFDNAEKLRSFQYVVENHLSGRNDPDRFGEQYIVDEEGYIVGCSEAFLSGAVDLSVEELVEMTHEQAGIAVAAHIDRESYSILSQLGFIPDSLPLDGVEITKPGDDAGYPQIACSDAHDLSQIGSRKSIVSCKALTFDEIRASLRGEGGRTIKPVWT